MRNPNYASPLQYFQSIYDLGGTCVFKAEWNS
ncbi:hypothetical protein A2U01_0092228, partial [Trifolium medium]|nr:hypothetical protein [Trifolium medium]